MIYSQMWEKKLTFSYLLHKMIAKLIINLFFLRDFQICVAIWQIKAVKLFLGPAANLKPDEHWPMCWLWLADGRTDQIRANTIARKMSGLKAVKMRSDIIHTKSIVTVRVWYEWAIFFLSTFLWYDNSIVYHTLFPCTVHLVAIVTDTHARSRDAYHTLPATASTITRAGRTLT